MMQIAHGTSEPRSRPPLFHGGCLVPLKRETCGPCHLRYQSTRQVRQRRSFSYTLSCTSGQDVVQPIVASTPVSSSEALFMCEGPQLRGAVAISMHFITERSRTGTVRELWNTNFAERDLSACATVSERLSSWTGGQ